MIAHSSAQGTSRYQHNTILYVDENPLFLEGRGQLRLVKSTELPPRELITTVHVLAFEGDRLLLVHNRQRGWEMPGGHPEQHETLQEAVAREAAEEGCVRLENLKPVGYWHVCCRGELPEGYKYPWPESYMIIYRARIASVLPWRGQYETDAREFIAVEDLGAHERGERFETLLRLISA